MMRSLTSRSSRAITTSTSPGGDGTRWAGAVPHGKLRRASIPWNRTCQLLYSRAASSTMWNDPFHFLLWVSRSVISAAHVPHTRWRMPRYFLYNCHSGGRLGKSKMRRAGTASAGRRRLEEASLEDARRAWRRGSATGSADHMVRRLRGRSVGERCGEGGRWSPASWMGDEERRGRRRGRWVLDRRKMKQKTETGCAAEDIIFLHYLLLEIG